VGKGINLAPTKMMSLAMPPSGEHPDIELNIGPSIRGISSEEAYASSVTTSAADPYNLYHFDEASILKPIHIC
jgi:hypothetical protein